MQQNTRFICQVSMIGFKMPFWFTSSHPLNRRNFVTITYCSISSAPVQIPVNTRDETNVALLIWLTLTYAAGNFVSFHSSLSTCNNIIHFSSKFLITGKPTGKKKNIYTECQHYRLYNSQSSRFELLTDNNPLPQWQRDKNDCWVSQWSEE